MSEDPKLFDAGDYNLFRYCHNDPVDNVDPMGLEENLAQKPISAWDPTSRAWAKKVITGSHIAISIQDALAWRELVGLSFTFARASESSFAGLTIGQVVTQVPRFVRVNRHPELEGKSPRELGMKGVQWAEEDHKKDGQYYGYNFYRLKGELVSVKSLPGEIQNGRFIELNLVPKGGDFLANGHVHPRGRSGFAFSNEDKILGDIGPVLKHNYQWHTNNQYYYDEYYKGVTSVVRPDGTTWKTY